MSWRIASNSSQSPASGRDTAKSRTFQSLRQIGKEYHEALLNSDRVELINGVFLVSWPFANCNKYRIFHSSSKMAESHLRSMELKAGCSS